jgi:hypothetical protein
MNSKTPVQKMIIENYGECGFTDTILMEIMSVMETTSGKGYSVHVTPKSNIISLGLSKSIEQAHSLAERNNREFCYYLEISLKKPMVIQLRHPDKLAKNANFANIVL